MDKIEQRVVVTDSQALLEPGIESLRARGVDVEVLPEGTTGAEAASKAADAPAAIIGLLPFRGPEIAALRRTGLLVRAGIGYDIIDVGAATDAGIWVANVPDYCVDEVADHALLLLLSALRRLTELETRLARRSLGQREPRPAGPPDPWAAPRDRRLRADRACGGAAGARLRLRGRGP